MVGHGETQNSAAPSNDGAAGLGMLQRVGVQTVDRVPVHHGPPSGEIVGPLLPVHQSVGVFPDIDSQDGRASLLHQIYRRLY